MGEKWLRLASGLLLLLSSRLCFGAAAQPQDGTKKLTLGRVGQAAGGAEFLLLPKPLFDENPADLFGVDAESRAKGQLVFRRANRHVIALQYVETIRSYVSKAGKMPQTLEELKADLPDDPVAGKPFSYKRVSNTQAVLEGPLPQGGDLKKDTVRYELSVGK